MKRFVVIAAVVSAMFAGLVVPVATAAVTTRPLYVQLGDSFASGVGAEPYEAASRINECNRSNASSYGAHAARALGYRFKNVACSGATTAAITSSFKGEAAQAAAVGGAAVVAISIGGNDVHVYDALTRWPVGGETAFYRDVPALRAKLTVAYAAIKKTAPKAKVVVVGYPDIFPADQAGFASCFSSVVSRVVDVSSLHAAMKRLNAEIAAAARASGATFVNTSPLFVGHDVCSASPWANQLGLKTVLSSGALHPNATGYYNMGKAVAASLRRPVFQPVAVQPVAVQPTVSSSTPSSSSVLAGGTFVESAPLKGNGWVPIPRQTR